MILETNASTQCKHSHACAYTHKMNRLVHLYNVLHFIQKITYSKRGRFARNPEWDYSYRFFLPSWKFRENALKRDHNHFLRNPYIRVSSLTHAVDAIYPLQVWRRYWNLKTRTCLHVWTMNAHRHDLILDLFSYAGNWPLKTPMPPRIISSRPLVLVNN